ncbi:hypothetical protein LJ739_16630 [Aestuariibacter halophilus]|uniref:Thioredoxin n=1 Tax=Fluctibacter halophilus TaxID=226011 RepID=A0ABS8GDC5_9ALTE|nr:hypothetical protein [Aestuariibacter halophilus]MCC2617880.1 hypothetical protein [Aestuariibacter halophilus]
MAKKCTIIYALEGIPYQSFSSQLDALHWHLKQLDITLIDLNHWHSAPLHEPLSGRERALLRDRFVLNAPHTGAVLLNRHGTILQRYEHMVDLVDLLMTCQSPQRSQPRHRQMASQQ